VKVTLFEPFPKAAIYAPSLSTSTRSLSITVGIRCAIVQTVQSLNSLLIIFCIRLSVAVSTDAVASSSTSIFDCFSRARPKETSCRCPTLQLSPFSSPAEFKKKKKKKNLHIATCDCKQPFLSHSYGVWKEKIQRHIPVVEVLPGISSFRPFSRMISPS